MCYAQSKPTNGLVLELEKFRSKNSLPFHVMGTCLRRLAGQADTSGILLPALSKKVDKLKLQQAKLREKNKKVWNFSMQNWRGGTKGLSKELRH